MTPRKSALALLIMLTHAGAFAQHLSGTLPASSAGAWIRLLVSRGSAAVLVDSARIDGHGHFDLGSVSRPTGFYHLALNDSDVVDVIVDPREKEISLAFSGTPLQEHITVVRSDENKRLWQYKFVSRESQAVQASVAQEKSKLQPTDKKQLDELDSTAARAARVQMKQLDQVVRSAPTSYFAKIIRADHAVESAEGASPMAVTKAFDLGDPSLMRSSLYDKAVMTFLRNVNAMNEEQFVTATDTLIVLASKDKECRAYMIDHLIDLFSTYGPEMPLQWIVDRYVIPQGLNSVSPALRQKVSELMKVSVGATAPDPTIPTPQGPRRLSDLVKGRPRTVLFFYSSTCDHCHKQLPPLEEIYKAEHPRGLEVIGYALDTDSAEFQQNIAEMGLTFPCYSGFNAWGGETPKLFQVKATPAFFLLDDRMRILAKPVDAVDLRRWLDSHPH